MTTLLLAPTTVPDREIRDELRRQIARLEADLPLGPGRGGSRGARILTIEELELTRDYLVRTIQERRFTEGEAQDRKRRLREEMLLHPEQHRGASVANAEVGEPGCTRWQCWFRLTISGGCP